jgi:dimethylhistidine N-methyltransferase
MITTLPEYYPTRIERTIMAEHAAAIAKSVGTGVTLVDLGAGNCQKAGRLFGSLRPVQYVAVDISVDFLRNALADLHAVFPEIEMLGVGADVSAEFSLPSAVSRQKRLFFYPGSSIGNFTPEKAHAFLTQIRKQCGANGSLLIGVDLIKSAAILKPAYDDARGVTAAFNLNLLNNLNRLIDSDFVAGDWRHRAFFNAAHSCIEMHLEAKNRVRVEWPNGARTFRKGECIHTENSYKYALPDFEDLLTRAGFRHVRTWTDASAWFAVCHATAD